ncbi:MAG: hypothetical protein QNL97_09225, partial [Pseudomonadales bacterium]
MSFKLMWQNCALPSGLPTQVQRQYRGYTTLQRQIAAALLSRVSAYDHLGFKHLADGATKAAPIDSTHYASKRSC